MGGSGIPDLSKACIEVAKECPNVHLVGSNIGWKKVISAIRELGAERVSFGSDLPFSDMHADLEAYKAFLSDYFTQKEKEFVLGKNIERVFRL